jgi:hypothetical protein
MSIKQDKQGHVLCDFCEKIIHGNSVVNYTYEEDDDSGLPDTISIKHPDCIKIEKMKKEGFEFECPKCKTNGKIKKNAKSISNKARLIECSLCNGRGWLKNKPIPIIMDWKLE